MSFHLRLLELEAELLAKEQSTGSFEQLPADCQGLLEFIEKQVSVRLSDKVAADWKGWLSYRRGKSSLVICRGRAFRTGMFGGFRAGCDVSYGCDTATEYQRGFDVSPPPDIDHLMMNFGDSRQPKVFLWYGENIAAYRLIFTADVADDPHHDLSEAVVEACVWIVKRPKHQTLIDFLKEQEGTT
jgi:hypothetical protein